MNDDRDNKLVIGNRRAKEQNKGVAVRKPKFQGTDPQHMARLDRDNEVGPPATIAPSVGQAMQSARLELGLTQKQAAQRINEKVSVIQDYESGKGTPDQKILFKLERLLNVKLRGSDIGKTLERAKKT